MLTLLIETAKLWGLKYDAKTHRLGRQGHIINLAVKLTYMHSEPNSIASRTLSSNLIMKLIIIQPQHPRINSYYIISLP